MRCVEGCVCLSVCLSFSPWKAAASASCQGELIEILLQLRKSQASPCRELGLKCSHLPFPTWGKCLIIPADPKNKGFQGLFCNPGEIEALGSPGLARQAALVLCVCPLLQCAPEETAVHVCCAAVFSVFLVNCLLVNTIVLLLCAKAASSPLWADLEILPAAQAEQTL